MFTEMYSTLSGSSSVTTTGVGTEVSSEVVLLFCGILAGWFVLPLVSALCANPVCGKLSAMNVVDNTTSPVDSDDDGSWTAKGSTWAEEDRDEEEHSISTYSSTAGMALLEQYGVFGATPGSWHSCL